MFFRYQLNDLQWSLCRRATRSETLGGGGMKGGRERRRENGTKESRRG